MREVRPQFRKVLSGSERQMALCMTFQVRTWEKLNNVIRGCRSCKINQKPLGESFSTTNVRLYVKPGTELTLSNVVSKVIVVFAFAKMSAVVCALPPVFVGIPPVPW